MAWNRSYGLTQAALLLATVSAAATKGSEHHFWKPLPFGGNTVTQYETVTETSTIVQTQMSTITVLAGTGTVTETQNLPGPTNTFVQTVVVSNVPMTFYTTQFQPVHMTTTETQYITQVNTFTQTEIITQTISLPGIITTATLVPEPRTITINQPSFITLATPTFITVPVPTTHTQTVAITSNAPTVYATNTETVYIPTYITIGCGCPTPPPPPPPIPCPRPWPVPCPPAPCPPTPPNPCQQPNPGCAKNEREPIPVRLHRKLVNKARNYINSEERELGTENWKTPADITEKYKKKYNQQPKAYVQYRKDTAAPCAAAAPVPAPAKARREHRARN